MVYTIVVHLYAKPEAEAISKLKAKLVEASQVYSQDKETLSWFVMQDVSDERKFTIVERYLKESVSASSRKPCHLKRSDVGIKTWIGFADNNDEIVANIPSQQPVLEDV
jgi:quinol monooxygenase YgiN